MTTNQYKILIAEDEAEFRHEIGTFLARNGYEVVTVEDGYQALEYAVREAPDLLILDVHMPAGDGFSVHERVQKHPELAVKPVIYMTHDHSNHTAQDASAHHAFALMYKPFNFEDLLVKVSQALNVSSGKEAA